VFVGVVAQINENFEHKDIGKSFNKINVLNGFAGLSRG
jgi:hypothetical protein